MEGLSIYREIAVVLVCECYVERLFSVLTFAGDFQTCISNFCDLMN